MAKSVKRYRAKRKTDKVLRHKFRRMVDFAVRYHFCMCYLCGQPILPNQRYNLDHVRPVSKGGMDCFENLRPVHYDCNAVKADQDLSIELLVNIKIQQALAHHEK